MLSMLRDQNYGFTIRKKIGLFSSCLESIYLSLLELRLYILTHVVDRRQRLAVSQEESLNILQRDFLEFLFQLAGPLACMAWL